MDASVAPFVGKFDKVTLITGGSKGIGEGCARVFVAAGASVVVCARGRESGESLARELTRKGPGQCHFEPCDVSNPDDIRRVVDKTVELNGRLDCLINNAGQHPPHRPIDEFSIEDFSALLQLNLVSYFAACKFALPHLRKTRGSIINMGSIVGEFGQWNATTYCATKGGIQGLTKALAIEEAKHGVRVNAVLPGNIITQSRIDFEAKIKNRQEFHDAVESWQWMGRSGTSEETGYVCLFLASDAASYVTGIDLLVSGGMELGQGPKVPILGATS
ncbi:MAG: SDR family oxidoreductase [Chloroflexi bacterium]|nr:SDR family oxidoreductase [Chloroflexota bacterium]